ncbi:MAG: hypothetical protein ACOC0N_00020 [Chroococcales cyanobacterium]
MMFNTDEGHPNPNPQNREDDGEESIRVYLPNNNHVSNGDSYEHGYVHGRMAEHRLQQNEQTFRDSNNTARGLLIGIIFTGLVGLAVAMAFFLNNLNETQAPTPVTVPEEVEPEEPDTTIIERSRETIPVPVPQEQPQQPAPPQEANITIPESEQPQAPNPPSVEETSPEAEAEN